MQGGMDGYEVSPGMKGQQTPNGQNHQLTHALTMTMNPGSCEGTTPSSREGTTASTPVII